MAAAAIASLLGAAIPSHSRADELTSAPIDRTIFRDGAVERSQRAFGAWTLVCDEVKSLQKRFCSLATEPMDSDGRPGASLVVSTGDNGKPAAILRTPVGVDIAAGVEIAIDAAPGKAKGAAPASKTIDYLRCGAGDCVAIWTLSQIEIGALNAGGAIRIRYRRVRELPLYALHIADAQRSALTETIARGAGFKDAVTASLK